MQNKITTRKYTTILIKSFVTIILIIVSVITLLPLYYLLLSSFTDTSRLFNDGITLIPKWGNLGFFNYQLALTTKNGIYFSWYLNSVEIAAMYTIGGVFLTSMVGYALGTYRFKGRNLLFVLVLIVMMIPIEILMLPLYSLTVKWRIINTKAGVILPFIVAGNAIFFFRQFTSGLPMELKDAGRIDGATEYGIFFRIMLPLMKPALGAMTILLAMASWNQFMWPLIVLRENQNFTLPVGLASLISPYGDNYAVLLPGAVLAIVPVVILFFFNQRYFVSGLTSGGVKG